MSVEATAFSTTILLAAGTATCVFAAINSIALVTTVAFAALGLTIGAVGIASVTAYFDRTSISPGAYLSNVSTHSCYAIAGVWQFVAQTLVLSMIQGLANGIFTWVSDKVSGRQQQC